MRVWADQTVLLRDPSQMCHTGWGISTEAVHFSGDAGDAPQCLAEGGGCARWFPGASEAGLARTSLLTPAQTDVSLHALCFLFACNGTIWF